MIGPLIAERVVTGNANFAALNSGFHNAEGFGIGSQTRAAIMRHQIDNGMA